MSVKQCSVIFSSDQRFSALIIAVAALKVSEFLLCNNTGHGCFSSETVIFIEIHAMCINYQFWTILKNLFTSLNQSGVSMIIAESSKDVNSGYRRYHYCQTTVNSFQSNFAKGTERKHWSLFWIDCLTEGKKRQPINR